MPHSKTHGVMFHNFHSEKHSPVQGSISGSDFKKMLDWLNHNYNLLGAGEYLDKFEQGVLKESDICLTFDDALKCQYDIAIPILNKLNIDAFFFIYTSIFTNSQDPLELYRYFRNTSFVNIDDFYEDFFEVIEKINPQEFLKQYDQYKESGYLSQYPFYTENDKLFRYLRDYYLSADSYHESMIKLMEKREFNLASVKKNLWISKEELKNIKDLGHMIGLHSHTHPTRISKLNHSEQEFEYKQNNMYLKKLIGEPIISMSHPNGDYNKDTLSILSDMNIKIGFRDNMSGSDKYSPLEIPREDHSNIYTEMHK
tara:strand:+ start:2661 stop:3596 length:936 start_codon:yes stop_codon:yes gene_type:complete